VLVLPNFDIPSKIETYAYGIGIRDVLIQDKHPIAYSLRKWPHQCKNSLHILENFMQL